MVHYTRAIQKVKNVCAYSPRTCFVAADHWFLVFSVMLKIASSSCVRPCHVISCGIGHVDWESRRLVCEVRGVIRFLQDDEILGYLAEEASSRVELFCCTTMHVRILPGRRKPCCVSNSIGTSRSILRTVRTWHRRTFSCFQIWKRTLLVNASKMMKTWRMLSIACLVWWLARLTAIQEVPGSIPGYTLEIFPGSIGSGTGSTQPRDDNWVATW